MDLRQNKLHARLISILRIMASPLKIIRTAGWRLLAYLCFFGGLGFAGIHFGTYYLSQYLIQVQDEFPGSIVILSRIQPWMSTFLVIIFAPALISAMILPARLTWQHQSLPFDEVLLLTPKLTQKFAKSIYAMLRPAFYILLPGFGMLFLYFTFVRDLDSNSLYQIYSLGCVLVGIVVLFKAIPVLLSPVIALCSTLEPPEATYYSRTILGSKSTELTILSVCTILLWLSQHYFVSNFLYMFRHSTQIQIEFILSCILAWYYLSCASIVTLISLSELNPPSAQQPEVLPPISKMYIQRAWVQD